MKQILLFFWIFVATSCSFETKKDKTMKIEDVVQKANPWLDYAGVVGVAQSVEKGKDVILVLVSSNTDSLKKQIPKTFHGYPVILKYVGEINAQ
jgi:hypothetical protein